MMYSRVFPATSMLARPLVIPAGLPQPALGATSVVPVPPTPPVPVAFPPAPPTDPAAPVVPPRPAVPVVPPRPAVPVVPAVPAAPVLPAVPVGPAAPVLPHAPPQPVRADILPVRRDGPVLAERILAGAAAIPVQLVGERPPHLAPGLHGPVEQRVAVRDVEAEAARDAAQRARALRDRVRVVHRVGEHPDRTADLDLRVAHLAVGHRHAEHLLGAERLLVERDRVARALHADVRDDRRVPRRNRLHLIHIGHGSLLGAQAYSANIRGARGEEIEFAITRTT